MVFQYCKKKKRKIRKIKKGFDKIGYDSSRDVKPIKWVTSSLPPLKPSYGGGSQTMRRLVIVGKATVFLWEEMFIKN